MVRTFTNVQVYRFEKGLKLTSPISKSDCVHGNQQKNLKHGHGIALLFSIVVIKLQIFSLSPSARKKHFFTSMFWHEARYESATICKTQLEIATKGELKLYCFECHTLYSRY